MNTISFEEMESQLNQKKGSYKIRLCLKDGCVTILRSTKTFYNHKTKCNGGEHVEIQRKNFAEKCEYLKQFPMFVNGVAPCRKPRNDMDKNHVFSNVSVNGTTLGSTSVNNSNTTDPNLDNNLAENIELLPFFEVENPELPDYSQGEFFFNDQSF